jgi:hypothetical protein
MTESPAPLPDQNNTDYVGSQEAASEPAGKARKPDHRLSMGPEKAWSISTGEASGSQDGQVEKSITEAIAGVEHNARASRKASHSLRFFKEGNPDEKAKKRDSKAVSQQRERLPPTAEVPDAEQVDRGVEVVKSSLRKQPTSAEPISLTADRIERSRTIPTKTTNVEQVSASPTEYTLDERGEPKTSTEEADAVQVLGKPALIELDRPISRLTDRSPDLGQESRRKSDASTGADEVTEEGEESGEETKISSAVFLPHQAPEQSEEEDAPVSCVAPRIPPSRTLSRSEDFHSWLVKADDSEPEVVAKEERERVGGGYERERERKLLRSEPVEAPIVAPEVDSSQVDGSAIPEEKSDNIVSTPHHKISRPVSQYQDEIVHDHQWTQQPKQPLECIELVPYKHQVGGHTTIWRFSRRAVCKKLNSRENEFYENMEKFHRDLLAFLPRYVVHLLVLFFVVVFWTCWR